MTKKLKTKGELPILEESHSAQPSERTDAMQTENMEKAPQPTQDQDAKKAAEQGKTTGPVYSDWAAI